MQAPLVAPQTTIGYDKGNDVRIDDRAVSRKHAIIELKGDDWYIFDAGSRNGVLVNKERIGREGRRIKNGDKIVIGSAELTITLRISKQFKTVVDMPAPLKRPSVEAQPPPPAPPAPPAPPPPVKKSSPKIPPSVPPAQPVVESKAERPQAGKILDGRYQLEAQIAQGSAGTVFRARRILLGDFVAVKILHRDLMKDSVAVERFRRQAQVAARIHHPNSVQIYDFGVSPEGDVYIVEELLSGRTLRDAIVKERAMTLRHIVEIFNQLCGAAHAAHLNGIVLRDIKPESIFLEQGPDKKELVKVSGYGLAKIDSSLEVRMTMAAQAKVLGKPQYMSPEQWLDQPLDSRSDVYALGIILFELLTGTVPFDSDLPVEIAEMHLSGSVPDITGLGRPDLDEGLASVVNRALAKDPRERQPTALHLAAELQAVSGTRAGLLGTMINKLTRVPPVRPVVVTRTLTPPPPGEHVLPSVVAEAETRGRGALNRVVVALMFEAFLSRISTGLIKTAVPLYALLVFGLDIAAVMVIVLIQNVVPLVLRPFFGSLADKYGKKRVFLISLVLRTVVSVLYAVATLPILFLVSLIRGMADSAKGPSTSALIADNTDEKHIAKAYSFYTTIKSASGGIGEALSAFLLVTFMAFLIGTRTVTANVAVLDEVKSDGSQAEQFIGNPDEVASSLTLPPTETHPEGRKVLRVEQREVQLGNVPLDDLPKVADNALLKKALVIIFIIAAALSGLSLLLVFIFIDEKKKEKKPKKAPKGGGEVKVSGQTVIMHAPQQQPNVWAFALLGALVTAPAYMVTGEFFTLLAVKLDVTPNALGWIKILAETVVPLAFGPFFGWFADRSGAGKVIALRSISNLVTSALFWITPWFAGTAFLGLLIGGARAIDEMGKAAFKPTWGAIAAKVSSFNLANRTRAMGILEGGVDASDLTFPVLAGLLLQYFSLGILMFVRAMLAVIAEIYVHFLTRKYKI